MPKVTTQVDVKFLVELSREEATALRDVLGALVGEPSRLTYAIYDKLDDAVVAAQNIVKGVE